MTEPANLFFDRPILNSPYAYPDRHWELDERGQPTQQIVDRRRLAEFVTPIPKPKGVAQQRLAIEEDEGLSSDSQRYEIARINTVRQQVDAWRRLPMSQWRVTPETARLLDHWRNHKFASIRPFQAGDRLRRIHWPRSLRSGALHVTSTSHGWRVSAWSSCGAVCGQVRRASLPLLLRRAAVVAALTRGCLWLWS